MGFAETAAARDALIRDTARQFGGQLANFNLSEANAVKRLIQIPACGVFQCDVSKKFYKPQQETPDIHEEDKAMQRKLLESILKECKKNPELARMGWTLVLFKFELYKGHGRSTLDWGQLAFCNNAGTKWILLNAMGDRICECCGNAYEKDYEELMRCHAQRFLNLLTYLPTLPKPEWVRSCFTTNQYEQIHPSLLDFSKTSYIPIANGLPSVGHYTPKDLQPCLSEVDLTRIDGFLSTFRYPAPSEEVKKKVRVPAGQTNPCAFVAKYMHPQFTQPIKRECHGCGTCYTFEQLKYCTGCYGVLFCSPACQKGNWKVHKLTCRPR
ncbi:hypothetical protein JCM5353_001556 [Sporobolomyces roseus]